MGDDKPPGGPEQSRSSDSAREQRLLELQRHNLRIAHWDAWMRRLLALTLIFGIFAVVMTAIATKATVADYGLLLTPLASLAGIAIGYYFGQSRPGAPSNEHMTDGEERRT